MAAMTTTTTSSINKKILSQDLAEHRVRLEELNDPIIIENLMKFKGVHAEYLRVSYRKIIKSIEDELRC